MAKFFFSTNTKISRQILEHCKKQEFDISFNEVNESINILSFYKKNIKEKNFFEDGSDLIIGIGSIIYNNFSKNKALQNILNDFHSKNDIQKIKQDILGNYFILIKKNDRIYIFNDASHSIPIFYFANEKNIVVGNDLYDISKNIASSEKLTLNEENFLEGIFQNAILGNRTMFNEIKKLLGHELIEINPNNKTIQIHQQKNEEKFELNEVPRETQVKEYANLILSRTTQIVKHFKIIGIFMTGGLDSRVTLAAFLNAGIKPVLFYGIGNSPITNTKREDYNIVKKIAKIYNLQLITMDWESPVPIDKYWNEMPDKYGFFTDIYSGTKNVIDEIEKIKEIDFLESGYMGESIKNNQWLDELTNISLPFDKLAKLYINKYNRGIYKKSDKIKESILKNVQEIYSFYGIIEKKITKDEYFLLDNEYRKNADVELLNFTNHYINSISISNQNELLFYAARIPYSYKSNNSFPIDVIRYLYPDLLTPPILTHGNPMILKDLEKSKQYKGKRIIFKYSIKQFILKNKLLLKISLRTKLFLFPLFDKEKYDIQLRSNYIKKYLSKKYSKYNRKGIKNVAYASTPYITRYYLMRSIVDRILKQDNE